MGSVATPSGEMTYNAIVDAAYQLFAERGYNAASMRRIAALAGITAGSIYNHFTDKEQIFRAVILKYHPIVRVMPRLGNAEGTSAEDLIRDAASWLAKEVETNPGILKLVSIEIVEMGGRHIPGLVQDMLPEIQRFLERIYATGQIRRPRDPVSFMRAFLGTLLGYALINQFLDQVGDLLADLGNPNQPLDELIEVFLYGVLDNAPAAD